jgi:EmrB/QacA subfamily drug resistance transporter
VNPVAPSPMVRRAWPLLLMCLAGFMVALDLLVVATALPSMRRDLHTDVASLGWTVSAYTLTFAAGTITGAALGDRLGRRRMFSVGLALFTAASAACALAPSAPVLIATRAIQGIGAAIVTPLSLTILAGAFPPQRRGTIVGIWGGVAGLAVAAGPLVGGALTQALSWHWVFWVNVPVGVVVSALARLRLGESRGPASRLDLPGLALAGAGATALIWGLIRASQVGWSGTSVVVGLAVGVVLLSGFVAWESRTREPMLPMRLFRNRSFAAANASGFLMSASLIPAAFLISQYIQMVQGASPMVAGLRFLPMTATPLLVAPLAGMLSDRIGQRPLMALGLLLEAGGLAWFALTAIPGASYGSLILPLLVAGAGVSMPFATTATAALAAVAPADIGKASGAANTMRQFGGAFGVAVATALLAGGGRVATPASFDAGFRAALAVAAVMALVGAVAALGVSAQRQPRAVTRHAKEPVLLAVHS